MTTVGDALDKVQVWSGPKLFVRLYGRFVFIRSGPNLRILAVDVGRGDCDAPNTNDDNSHKPFMTVREKNVGSHTVNPSSRIIGTEIAPFEGALNVWDMSNWTVTVQSSGGVSWPAPKAIPLADLGHLSDRDLDPKKVEPGGPKSRVTAIIDIQGGYSVSFHLPTKQPNPFGTRYDIVTVKNPREPDPGQPRKQALADMVQITVDLPPDGIVLTVDQNKSSKTAAAAKDQINIKPGVDQVVVLSLSNLCSGDLQDGPDFEFAQFYCLLKDPPDYEDRRIPTLYPADKIVVQSPRFGDCFLGAMISAPSPEKSQ